MWYPAAVTSPPATEPVTLATVKAHLRVDSSDEDTLIAAYIAAARSYVESYCGTPLVSRSVTFKCDGFSDFAKVRVAPLASVSAVKYLNSEGAETTLLTDVYEVRSDGLVSSIVLKDGQSWPAIQTGSRISVEATAGYTIVPEAITHAILLLVGHWYANREAVANGLSEPPHAVEALLTNFRSYGF